MLPYQLHLHGQVGEEELTSYCSSGLFRCFETRRTIYEKSVFLNVKYHKSNSKIHPTNS